MYMNTSLTHIFLCFYLPFRACPEENKLRSQRYAAGTSLILGVAASLLDHHPYSSRHTGDQVVQVSLWYVMPLLPECVEQLVQIPTVTQLHSFTKNIPHVLYRVQIR